MNDKITAIIRQITEKIKQDYQPDKIILFGSYAYGRPSADSDIDIFIIKDDPRQPIDRDVHIRRILCQENREIALTPMVYTPAEVAYRLSIGDDFVNDVITKGKVLYAR